MVPAGFDESFLAWFREATEKHWSWRKPRTFDEIRVTGVGALEFAQGTRWSPLGEAEIEDVERRTGVPLPPDYRRFLAYLHATTPKMVGALFVGEKGELTPVRRPGFYDWREEGDSITRAGQAVVDGLVFDVEHNRLWLESWGTRPVEADARRSRVAELVAGAPRLIPLFGHRYLLAEPCREGNPVLSIHQSDIVVYGRDLREYLMRELQELVGFEWEGSGGGDEDGIPFWGELMGR